MIDFWVIFLLPLGIGFAGGWWVREVRAREDDRERETIANYIWELEEAKRRHPSNREGYYEERLF